MLLFMNSAFVPLHSAHIGCYCLCPKKKKETENANRGLEIRIQSHTKLSSLGSSLYYYYFLSSLVCFGMKDVGNKVAFDIIC